MTGDADQKGVKARHSRASRSTQIQSLRATTGRQCERPMRIGAVVWKVWMFIEHPIFRDHCLDFKAKDYFALINWQRVGSFEPPLLMNVSFKEIEAIVKVRRRNGQNIHAIPKL
ncbi:hypothetical protein AVEN_128458-1 [Araneus ventricosus]|uniref:Uncharacterized protein n=1 Tax=Araneus ventricosus TaxID=182803 RepID=A0A4Y2N216_ARAVE|nr:hypothetical protein AVEN_128458-1 [Araneus ventricosus]